MTSLLAAGPATRRRRVSSGVWRVLTYLALVAVPVRVGKDRIKAQGRVGR